MFMGNDEIKNTIALIRIKFRSSRIIILRTLLIIGLVFLAFMIPSLVNVLKYKDTVSSISISDYSYLFFLGLLGAVIISCIRYKQINDIYTIYPQTGTSRFISTQLILYLWLGLISIISLVLYIIKFLTFKLLSEFNSNIILAFRTDIGLILTGIFIFYLYGMLMIALFSLIGTIIRRFGTIAIGCFMIIIAIILTSEEGVIKTVPKLLSFLTEEPSISIFLLKALSTWLGLVIIALLINKHTSYYNAQPKSRNSIVTIVGIAALILISIIRASQPEKNGLINNPSVYYSAYNDSVWLEKSITLDTSDYADLSRITVKTDFDLEDDMYLEPYSPLLGRADTIEIRYRLPVRIFNDYNLTELTKPSLAVKLEGNELDISYSYNKNTKVIFLSPWFVMKQFERYQDKELFFNLPDFYTSTSRSTGQVNITAR